MDITFSRRSFLKLIAISSIVHPAIGFPQNKKGKLLISTYNKERFGGSNFAFLVLDLDNGKTKQIPTTFLLHSFEVNPLNQNEIIAMSKWTPELFIFDLNGLKIKKTIKSEAPNELFVGHGNYSPDGTLFYASMSFYDKNQFKVGKGLINTYDIKSGKKINSVESGGFEPHMSLLLNNGKELLVLNTGAGIEDQNYEKDKKQQNQEILSSITIVEPSSGNLLKKIDLKQEKLSFSHLSANKKDDIFLIGGKRSANNLWKPKSYKCDLNLNLTELELDEPEIHDQMLSPKIDKGGTIAGASSPWSNKVYFWNYKTKHLVKTVELEGPAGLDLTADDIFFVALAKNKIILLDSKKLELKKTINIGSNEPRAHCQIV